MEQSSSNFETTAEAPGEEWLTVHRLSERTENVGEMVVASEELRKVLKTITKLSPYRQTVLVEGESGTGKDLIARALHSFGGASNGPFVIFNCSNLVASLAEAQLFGHVKGAYTDAREDALGYFRSANGGTLFLDEIGELPLNLQPKLLRAVENREIQPVGSTHVYKVDLRLIAATNRDLRAMMKKGEFREDLYYRLSSAAIAVPPLRRRAESIPSFVAHFIDRYNKLFGKEVKLVAREAMRNVRLSMAGQYP
jgi:hydrogenase-4 transcriptional activator